MMFDFGDIASMFEDLMGSGNSDTSAEVDSFSSIDSYFGSAQGKKQPANFSFSAGIGSDDEEAKSGDLIDGSSMSAIDIVVRKMLSDSELSTADLLSLGK